MSAPQSGSLCCARSSVGRSGVTGSEGTRSLGGENAHLHRTLSVCGTRREAFLPQLKLSDGVWRSIILILIILIMVSGPGLVPHLVTACLLASLLHLPEARGSYSPQSGECRGKAKDCTGKRSGAGPCGAVRVHSLHPSEVLIFPSGIDDDYWDRIDLFVCDHGSFCNFSAQVQLHL